MPRMRRHVLWRSLLACPLSAASGTRVAGRGHRWFRLPPWRCRNSALRLQRRCANACVSPDVVTW